MISIRERFRPYSHQLKARCILPRTNIVVQGSPEKLIVGDLEVLLGNEPNLQGFTLQMDLEKDCVWVFGEGFRVKVFANESGIFVGDRFFQMKVDYFFKKEIERLFLGVHKAQDWELVLRRMDKKEIFPILYHLAQKVPQSNHTEASFDYQTFFKEMLIPVKENALSTAFEVIRSKFFIEDGMKIYLLPSNPFVSGRMQNVQTDFGSLDLLWSKKSLKRVTLYIKQDFEILLTLPEEIKTFRYKKHLNDRGRVHRVDEILYLEKGTLYLDRFFS